MTNEANNSEGKSRYRSILKSTSLIGGASVLNIIIGMVRTKFVAILLGPNGVGLLGMFTQITTLVSTVTSIGISSSGVRQVAEAVGTDDEEKIARTAIIVKRTAWITGCFGLLIMAVFSAPISRITFYSYEYTWPIAILSITMLTGAIAVGQSCVINGTRQIANLAKISVIGSISGVVLSVPCFYYWGPSGIVPSLVLSSLATLATSWWFARKVPVKVVTLSWHDCIGDARKLLLLGIGLMSASLVTALSGYVIRIVMLRQFSLDDLGIYQAAFSLSGVLVGFVLGAMGADYYPRLTAVSGNNASVLSMVNEQSQISILLSLPGLVAMMIFAPIVIQLFYAISFVKAVPILQWCILGVLGRVFSWPLGFVVLAKGKGRLFFITETIGAGFHLFFVYIFCSIWGLIGAGIAFFAVYVVYTLLMLLVMRRLVGATWTRSTLCMTLVSMSLMCLLMINCFYNKNNISLWASNVSTLIVVVFVCIRQLSKKSGFGINEMAVKLKLRY